MSLTAASSPSVHPPARRRQIEVWRCLALCCTVGLLVLGVGWELWWAPLKGGSGALALKVLPLTFFLPGLLKHRLRSYRGLSLLVWLYVTEGLMRLFTDRGVSAMLAGMETALSLLLFIACAVYVRLRLKALPKTVSASTPT